MLSIEISFLFFVLALVESTTMKQENGAIKRKGKFRYTYDEDVADNCESILLFGVGTGMTTGAYDILSKLISADKPIVTVFFDANPYSLVKFGEKKYANFYKAFTADLGAVLPEACKNKEPTIIAGGHSASGRGGLQAMMHEGISPDGFIGLSPFQAAKKKGFGVPSTTIDPDLPVLSWGFEKTTCMVNVAVAGRSEYELSGATNRVFFKANNVDKKIGHCEFTDSGCYGGIIPNCPRPGDVKGVVAESIRVFADIVGKGGAIEPSDFGFDTSNGSVGIDVFVNSATV